MMNSRDLRRRVAVAVAAMAAVTFSAGTLAQQKPEEEPGWAKGRPKTEAAQRMAPVPAFPIPTAAADLPTKGFKLPPGFKVETWASGVLDARGLRQGAKGTVFVSTLFVGQKIYAIPEKGSKEAKTIIDKMPYAAGIEYHKGALYVATHKQILRYDNIESQLDNPGQPTVLYDKLPGGDDHSWKFLRIRNDKLYFAIGAPCNICDPGDYAKIYRMSLDGSGIETLASGVRNTVGFDFHPKTGQLWFTDNGRDWMSEDVPNDELNVITGKDQHFGYPFCHQGNILDPEFGWGKSCKDTRKPAALLGPHAGALGLVYYTGKSFPSKYQGAMFIARHGPWNRTVKYADVAVAWPDGKGGAKVEPFMTGFVKDNQYVGRPADFLVLRDGSLLVSDDHAGAIYRISYAGAK